MRRGKLTATFLAILILAYPGPGWAKPPTPDAERVRLEFGAGTQQRSGVQEGPLPGIAYQGWSHVSVALRTEGFLSAGPGFGFGGFLTAGLDGFGLDDASRRLTEGRLLNATLGPAVRFAHPAFEVQAGAGYGVDQLPELGDAVTPVFKALPRHALIARLGLRIPLFSVVTLEAHGQAALLRSGGGLTDGGHGYLAGAALGVPVAQLSEALHLKAKLGYQVALDRWAHTQSPDSNQTVHRVALGLELAFGTATGTAVAPPPPPPEDTAEVAPETTGLHLRVTDRAGAPIDGAWARLGEHEVKATGPGEPLILRDLPAGTHSFDVGAPGHVEITDVVELVEGTTLELDVELTPQAELSPATVTGQVRSARTGGPLKAVLTIEGRKRPVRSDAEGRFTLELPDGTWNIRIAAPGHLSQRKQLSVREGDRTILNVDLHPERR